MEVLKYQSGQMEALGATLTEISNCDSEEAVSLLTQHIVRGLGAQYFVYSTMLASDVGEGRQTFRYLIGCKPEWCRIYNERKWFSNDPFLEYAKTNTAPLLISQIALDTPGQIEMMKTAADWGYRSGLIVPTHSSASVDSRMGMLYIGTEVEQEVAEPILWKNRIHFRALAMELLDWWIIKLREEGAKRFKLNAQEIQLLQCSKRGLSVLEISANFHAEDGRHP